MTHHAQDLVENTGIVLVSSLVGLLHYMADTEVLQAVLVAGLCGLVGGLAKGLGQHLWRKGHGRYQRWKDKA
jgi:hypothetical protein